MRLMFLCWVALSALQAHAQDPQLSQYYAAPLYLNPAFTGNLDYDCRKLPASRVRFVSNYRSQYAGSLQTYMTSLDIRSKNGNWGYGMLVYQDRQDLSSISSAPLQTYQASGLVSYKVTVLNDWKFHSGLQLGYLARTLNWDGFIFPNQLEASGVVRPSSENFSSTTKGGFDASAGVLIYNSDFYMGIATHHLNQVNMSLTEETSRWPTKIDVHTGYRIPLKKQRGFARRGSDKSITPVIHYKRQLNTQQLDIGTYFNYEPAVLGLWYRGVPFSKGPDGRLQQDALVVLAGLRAPTDYGLFKVGLSYDFPTSRGSTTFGRTFELSLAYQFIDERCRKRIAYKQIPCPGL